MKIDPRQCGLATRAVHVGHDPGDRPEDRTGAVTVPIYQTSTYLQAEVGGNPEYEYARVHNPTRTALEKNVASLEGGRSGHAFASGMAAISALLSLLDPGDEVVVSRDVYGGTRRFFNRVLARYGLVFHWVDTTRVEAVEAVAKNGRVRMVYVETPSNPMMEVTDLAAAAAVAHRHRALMVVDNTFMSPCLQRPLKLGADLVVHSTTKFMNGHSDSLGGVVVTAPEVDPAIVGGALLNVFEQDLGAHLAYMQKCAGGVLAPFECFLVLRGLRTLALRMERHEQSGGRLAAFLDAQRGRHRRIARVLYPGLADHPGHATQRRQASGFGAMISFDLGGLAAAKAFLESLRVFALAESLGGVESLACHPATMTHASVPVEDRASLGITDGLVRLSVGIECYEDLEADVAQALEAVASS